MANALLAWNASFTRRWHTNPHLCDSVDYDSGHQQRVALLVLCFRPHASRDLLITAILHDQGEHAAGDMPHPAKERNPVLRAMTQSIEHEAIAAQGFDLPGLSKVEADMLRMCDWADAYLWMLRHRPLLRHRADWKKQREDAMTMADSLGVGVPFARLVLDAVNFYVTTGGN